MTGSNASVTFSPWKRRYRDGRRHCLKRGGKLIADMGKAKKVLAESYQHIVDQVSKTKVSLPGGYKAD
jgi:hypothetical protein